MSKYICYLSVLLIFTINSIAQSDETHVWKPLDVESSDKFWYDSSAFDTVKSDRLDVWVLQSHKPPLQFEGFDGDVFRSKTFYRINLSTIKYGIRKIRYYNATNQEIYSYDYDQYDADDSLKYTFPIITGSVVHKVIQEFLRFKGVKVD